MKLADINQPCKFREENYVALDIAIKALEHPEKNVIAFVPCGDSISRQAVLNKLNRLIEVERLQGTDEMGYGRERVSAYECMIAEIESEYLYPSVNPQEPKTDVLDKIRAEIKGMYIALLKGTPKDDWGFKWNKCIEDVLEIIDKYKAESEGEHG